MQTDHRKVIENGVNNGLLQAGLIASDDQIQKFVDEVVFSICVNPKAILKREESVYVPPTDHE